MLCEGAGYCQRMATMLYWLAGMSAIRFSHVLSEKLGIKLRIQMTAVIAKSYEEENYETSYAR